MTVCTYGGAPVAAGSLICNGDIGRLSRPGSYASRQMPARRRHLHRYCRSVNVNESKFLNLLDGNWKPWSLVAQVRISEGNVIEFPVVEIDASEKPLVYLSARFRSRRHQNTL